MITPPLPPIHLFCTRCRSFFSRLLSIFLALKLYQRHKQQQHEYRTSTFCIQIEKGFSSKHTPVSPPSGSSGRAASVATLWLLTSKQTTRVRVCARLVSGFCFCCCYLFFIQFYSNKHVGVFVCACACACAFLLFFYCFFMTDIGNGKRVGCRARGV